jgi:hypothetical protein
LRQGKISWNFYVKTLLLETTMRSLKTRMSI